MKIQKKYRTYIIATVLIFSIGVYLGRESGPSEIVGIAGADPSGHVSVKQFRDGEVIFEWDIHNLITTNGSRHVRNFLGWANQTNQPARYISLSADASPQTSWEKLPNEITSVDLQRAAGGQSVVNSTAYQVTNLFIAAGSHTVNCTGLHWDPGSDTSYNLFAAASISEVNLQASDQLQVTWTVNIPDG